MTKTWKQLRDDGVVRHHGVQVIDLGRSFDLDANELLVDAALTLDDDALGGLRGTVLHLACRMAIRTERMQVRLRRLHDDRLHSRHTARVVAELTLRRHGENRS